MSTPFSDDETAEHRMYAPKVLREQSLPPAPQPVRSAPMPASHVDETSKLGLRGGLEDMQYPTSEPEAVSEPQPQHRRHSMLTVISWLAIVASCISVLIMVIDYSMKAAPQAPDTGLEVTHAKRSNRLAINKTPAVISPGAISIPGAQSAQLTAFARHVIQGVTDNEILFGISAPLSGVAKELGQNMKLGIEAAFKVANTNGGIHGRQLRLVAVDDGYEPTRTTETMKQLYEQDRVFGIVGNVGTPTAAVALPYALEHQMLFYGAFTGANLLRRDPPDRYVFNYRAGYAEETDAVVRYLVKIRRLRPEQIAVFAQQDSYGDAGFAGVAKAMRSLQGGDESTILRLNYKRNTVDVDEAVAQLQKNRIAIKAVIMVPAYRAAAKFVEKTRDLYPSMIYTSVSFVGSTALASELMLLGRKYAQGVIVTQVVPAVDGHSSVVLDYKSALSRFSPGQPPDYVSLEGYVAGSILVEALKRNGPQLDTERLVDTFENLHDFDLGLGTPITFGRSKHQAVHKVWGTELDGTGHYQPIDLQ
jgi:branched-chain amino acid transport system substrate-binding protein